MKTNLRCYCSDLQEINSLPNPTLNNLLLNEQFPNTTLSDFCTPKFIFKKHYLVFFPTRNCWLINRQSFPPNSIVCYTDGSKTDKGTGYGIFNYTTNEKVSGSMGQLMTVFQAELTAINICTQNLQDNSILNRSIFICSDSSSALKALYNCKITSKLVFDTQTKLNKLGLNNNLQLLWVPAHCGISGNETADSCAKTGANSSLIGPEPFTGLPWVTTTSKIRLWLQNEISSHWDNLDGHSHSKLFIGKLNKTRSTRLLSFNRKDLRKIVGFLSGNCPVKQRLKLWGLSDDEDCRFCLLEPETAEHLLCYCEALEKKRYYFFETAFPYHTDYHNIDIYSLLRFIKSLKIYNTLSS